MKLDKKYLGLQIRCWRKQSGYSQTEIAKMLKVKPQFVSNWERSVSSPPLSACKKLEKIFSVKMRSILVQSFSRELARKGL